MRSKRIEDTREDRYYCEDKLIKIDYFKLTEPDCLVFLNQENVVKLGLYGVK